MPRNFRLEYESAIDQRVIGEEKVEQHYGEALKELDQQRRNG